MRSVLALLLLLAGSAAAQPATRAPAAASVAETPKGPQRSPAQRETLADLAYVLGQAHALRTLCDGEGEQVWRARMARMVDLESPDDAFREQLYDAFNTGFLGAQAAHVRCDPRARAALVDNAVRGRDLSQTLAGAR
jgi:uncharacterized protein (TIGR02301 family)